MYNLEEKKIDSFEFQVFISPHMNIWKRKI